MQQTHTPQTAADERAFAEACIRSLASDMVIPYHEVGKYIEIYQKSRQTNTNAVAISDAEFALRRDKGALRVLPLEPSEWEQAIVNVKPDCACTDETEEFDEETSNPVGVWLWWSTIIFAFVLGYYLGGRN